MRSEVGADPTTGSAHRPRRPAAWRSPSRTRRSAAARSARRPAAGRREPGADSSSVRDTQGASGGRRSGRPWRTCRQGRDARTAGQGEQPPPAQGRDHPARLGIRANSDGPPSAAAELAQPQSAVDQDRDQQRDVRPGRRRGPADVPRDSGPAPPAAARRAPRTTRPARRGWPDRRGRSAIRAQTPKAISQAATERAVSGVKVHGQSTAWVARKDEQHHPEAQEGHALDGEQQPTSRGIGSGR